MIKTTAPAAAWDTYAHDKPQRREKNSAGQTTWFNWTQFPDHGPGAEVLAITPGSPVLDLGCGKGGNLAHVATLGARAVGVDVSPVQLAAARDRWGHVPGLELRQENAVTFLAEPGEEFGAIYSVFGAVWFTDPHAILPAVRERLRPGGILVFSHRPPVEDCYGCQAVYMSPPDAEETLVVKRWDYPPEGWAVLLRGYGYSEVTARIIPPPPGSRAPGTLFVRAVRPAD